MPIKMNCPSCGKALTAPETAVGKKAKCPTCGQIMIVPEAVRDAEELGAPLPPPSAPFSPEPAAESSQEGLYGFQDPTPAPSAPDSGDEARRACPECGEMIVVGAAKCRFCGAIFDPRLKARTKKVYGSDDENLSTADWLICIFCSGIGCIAGIVYAVQGKPKGMKMVGISFGFGFIMGIIRAMIEAAIQNQHHFR